MAVGAAGCVGKVGAAGCRGKVGWAGCGRPYRQARSCPSVGSLQDVWMTVTDAATFTGAFSIAGVCYYFSFSDPTSGSPGTVYAAVDATAFADCCDCDAINCGARFPCVDYLVSGFVTIYNSLDADCSTGPYVLLCGPTPFSAVVSGTVGTCLRTGGPFGVCAGNLSGNLLTRIDITTTCTTDIVTLTTTNTSGVVACASVRARGGTVATVDGGAYPDNSCCGSRDPRGLLVFTGITVVCDDAP